MIKYVFVEYRDKAGIGSEVMFDDKTQAVEAAEKEWNHLSDKDKKSYLKDTAGVFTVLEVELTKEQVEQYFEGELDTAITEFEKEVVVDMLRA